MDYKNLFSLQYQQFTSCFLNASVRYVYTYLSFVYFANHKPSSSIAQEYSYIPIKLETLTVIAMQNIL